MHEWVLKQFDGTETILTDAQSVVIGGILNDKNIEFIHIGENYIRKSSVSGMYKRKVSIF